MQAGHSGVMYSVVSLPLEQYHVHYIYPTYMDQYLHPICSPYWLNGQYKNNPARSPDMSDRSIVVVTPTITRMSTTWGASMSTVFGGGEPERQVEPESSWLCECCTAVLSVFHADKTRPDSGG